MKITLLGTGTSHGIPVAGCSCRTCTSKDPKNTRYRTSVLLEGKNTSVVIDVPAEFRMRTLDHNIKKVDAVLLTHSHADHTAGLDDIRRYNEIQGTDIPLFADRTTLADVKKRFDYIFSETQEGGGKPRLKLNEIKDGNIFTAGDIEFMPVSVKHGCIDVMAFRAGDFAFVTDVSEIPEKGYKMLKGVKVLVLDALRISEHPTHFNLEQAISAALKTGAEKTYFTHIAHSLEYAETNAKLPENMELSYDGLVIEL